MKSLKEKDILILIYLDSKEPEGAFLNSIASKLTTALVKCSAQSAYSRLKKLINKEFVRHGSDSLYHIADKGKAFLNGNYVHDTQPKPKLFKSQAPQSRTEPYQAVQSLAGPSSTIQQAQPIQGQATNLHAFEVHYLIFPTSYSQAEARLATAKIPFKLSGNKKHPSYLIMFNGLRMRIGSRQLIAWGPELTEPIRVVADKIEGRALLLNNEAVAALLQKTGIRVQETLDNQIKGNVYYRELAIVNNAAMEKLQKGRGYIPIAYDRATGRTSIWLDPTPTPAAETNKKRNHEVLRKWGQGIEDGEIKPYEDEMQTRQDIKGLIELAGKQLQNSIKTDERLDFLARNIESHVNWMYSFLKASSEGKPLPKKPKPEDMRQMRL